METSKLSFWKIFAITLLISNMVILAFIFFEKPTSADNLLADQLLIQIANNQKAIEQITYEHFQSVKNICDSVQKEKFDGIILEVTHRMKDNRPKPNRLGLSR